MVYRFGIIQIKNSYLFISTFNTKSVSAFAMNSVYLTIFLLVCFAPQSLGWIALYRGATSSPASIQKLRMSIFQESWQKMISSVALGTAIFAGSPAAFADSIPAVGQAAPEFRLPSTLGRDISLDDLKGRRAVLYFYPADFTSGCTLEAQYFERDVEKYKELDTQIVGVSVDSVDKHLDFGKKCQLEFPLLSDKDGLVSNKYGSLLNLGFVGKFSNRQTYIISPDSKIEYVFTDVDGNLSHHSQDVLTKLQELKSK